MTTRRSFITGLISFVAAPAIVRAGSLMPVKVMEPTLSIEDILRQRMDAAYAVMQDNLNRNLYGDLPVIDYAKAALRTVGEWPFRQTVIPFEID